MTESNETQELLVNLEEVAERPKRRRTRPAPEPESVRVDVEEPKPRRRRRAKGLTAKEVAVAVESISTLIASMRGTPWWAYSEDEAILWSEPLADLLNRIPSRYLAHSSQAVAWLLAIYAFKMQTQERLEKEREWQKQRAVEDAEKSLRKPTPPVSAPETGEIGW